MTMSNQALQRVLAWILATVFPSVAFAILPESGMFWEPQNPGQGFYVEVQGNRAAMIVYSYDGDTGKPEIYIVSGELRDDASDMGDVVDAPLNPNGFYPLHWFQGDLVRFEGGMCLTCPRPAPEVAAEVVGTASVWFPGTKWVMLSVRMPDEPPGRQRQTYILERFNFAYERFVSEDDPDAFLRKHDLRGQWVFVDQTDPHTLPWRFDFDERTPEEPVWAPPGITYRDSARDAELRCVVLPTSEMPHAFGCELHLDGNVLFSAINADIGLNRIHAFLGTLPPRISPPTSGLITDPYRRAETVIGVRITTPPEAEED
jgi:hypothetical protein